MKKTVRIFYAFQFFFSLLLWLPIFYEYQKRIGLNDTQIFQIQSYYYLIFCFLEIPTGLFADRFGYLRSMQWGAGCLVLSHFFPIFAQSFLGFMAHFTLIALSRSFISGASSAYLYEFLKKENSLSEYKKVEGKARAYGLIGKVVCWAFVGSLMQLQLTLPYWLTLFSALLSFGFSTQLPAVSIQKRKANALSQIKGTFINLIQTPFLILVIFQGIGIFVLSRICQVNLFQPILESKHFALPTYGMIMSFMTVFEAVGSLHPRQIQKYFSNLHSVYIFTLFMAGSLIFIPFLGQLGTLFALGVFSYSVGCSFPIQRQLLNDSISDSTYRATLLSLESLTDRGINAFVAALIGSFLSHGKLDLFLIYSGVVTVFFMCLLTLGQALKKRAIRLSVSA